MTTVRISGWRRNFLTISFVKLLRSATGEGLASALEKVNQLLENNEEIQVQFDEADAATRFLHDAEEIGAIGTVSKQ
jgi:hypothetical protein